jgi:hypothetical protein
MNPIAAAISRTASKKFFCASLTAASVFSIGWTSSAQAAAFVPNFSFLNYPAQALDPGAPIDVLGYEFTLTNASRSIKSLGIFQNPGVPNNNDHTIGIWDFSTNPQTLLYSQQITASTSCTLFESYCWFNVPTLPLQINTPYVIASTWGGNQSLPFQVIPASQLSIISQFSLGANRVLPGTPSLPSYLVDIANYVPTATSNGDNFGFYSVNLSYDTYPSNPPSSSEVPAPLPLFGAAAAFGMSRKIRRRISAAS